MEAGDSKVGDAPLAAVIVAVLGTEIATLQEYRTRLIADVVMGKINVREAADVLPVEPAPQSCLA